MGMQTCCMLDVSAREGGLFNPHIVNQFSYSSSMEEAMRYILALILVLAGAAQI